MPMRILKFLTECTWFTHLLDVLVHSNSVDILANLHVFLMIWWAWWSWCKISSLMDSGIRICRPLNIIPDSTASSSRKDQYDRILAGTSRMVSGHLWYTISMARFMDGSLAVSLRSNFCFSTKKLIIAIIRSSSTSVLRLSTLLSSLIA